MSMEKGAVVVLNATADDYMSIEHIVNAESDGWPSLGLDDEAVAEWLRQLVGGGYVVGYAYSVENREYVASNWEQEDSGENLWFYITERGRTALDENWNDEWEDEEKIEDDL